MTRGALFLFALLYFVQGFMNVYAADATITITGTVYKDVTAQTLTTNQKTIGHADQTALTISLCATTETMFKAVASIAGSWRTCNIASTTDSEATLSIVVDTSSLAGQLKDHTSADFKNAVKDAIEKESKSLGTTAFYLHSPVTVDAVAPPATTTNTAQPAAGATQPAAGATQPAAGATQPAAGATPAPTKAPSNYKTVYVVGDVYQDGKLVTLTEDQKAQSTADHAKLEADLCNQTKTAFQTNPQIASAWHGCAIDDAAGSKVTLAVSFDADLLKAQNVDYTSADFMGKIAAAVKATSVPTSTTTYYFYMNVDVHGSALILVPSLTILLTTGFVCVLNFVM